MWRSSQAGEQIVTSRVFFGVRSPHQDNLDRLRSLFRQPKQKSPKLVGFSFQEALIGPSAECDGQLFTRALRVLRR